MKKGNDPSRFYRWNRGGIMTKTELHQFISESKGNESNICQIYAIKDGQCVYDDCWHGYKTENTVNVMSVTKGVMALLTGIAIDQGYIQN